MDAMISKLLSSEEPAIRFKILRNVMEKVPGSPEIYHAQSQIRCCARVQAMLGERDAVTGRLPAHPYQKWTGAHWVMASLADMGYPPGDENLLPLREQELAWLLPGLGKKFPYRPKPVIEGKVRTCGSLDGNALYALLTLGIADERVDLLVEGLLAWQWPDGGWNCDKTPTASRSSFHETLIPMRGLILYAKTSGSPGARAAAERAADIFLKRSLFRRLSDGQVMHPQILQLAYPPFWHYDVLFGLKVMAEGGWIGDPRCQEALDWLESRRLPDGGFPADTTYYRTVQQYAGGEKRPSGVSLVNWGGKSATRSNPWVTADALGVLAAAGRLSG